MRVKELDEQPAATSDSDLFNLKFLLELNACSDIITDKNDFVNELYLYFVIPLQEKIKLLDINSMDKERENKDAFWFEACRRRAVKQSKIKWLFFYARSILKVIFSVVVVFIYMFLLPFYVLFRFKESSSFNRGDNHSLAVIRSPASFSKMKYLQEEGVDFYCDSLTYGKKVSSKSIYRVHIFTRFKGVFYIPLYVIRDLWAIFFTGIGSVGFVLTADVLKHYQRRVVHKATFEFYVKNLIILKRPVMYFTGNKEDRFATLEGRLCNKYQVKVTCIPHGLEYAFKMPMGLVGDVFYCNTKYAKEYLEKLYKGSITKFVFDKCVVRNMLFKDRAIRGQQKIVFFPESRELSKDLVIIRSLKEHNVDFFLKLHPKDSIDNYRPYIKDFQLILDFDDAISNSICLARKSTILLESIYNDSVPIAVLVDGKDRSCFEFMFPSLRDESILKVYSFVELYRLLESFEDINV